MSRFRLVKAWPWLGYLFRPWVISNAYHCVTFLAKHRRIPRFSKTGYFNDLLFKIRALETDLVFRAFSSDKEFSKIVIRGLEGEDLSVPTLAILRDMSEVESFAFPDNCVIKPTHSSAEVIFHETGPMSLEEKARMKGWFDQNFGDLTGERNYRDLVPKIIVEPWLKLNGAYCHDYRFFMYGGELKIIEIKLRASETDHRFVNFTPDWKRVPAKMTYGAETFSLDGDGIEVDKPKCLDRMIEISRNVARYMDFVRVDFYTDCEDVFYVGEISHINAGVRQVFDPIETERLFTKPT